jgi:hypothetical protein
MFDAVINLLELSNQETLDAEDEMFIAIFVQDLEFQKIINMYLSVEDGYAGLTLTEFLIKIQS